MAGRMVTVSLDGMSQMLEEMCLSCALDIVQQAVAVTERHFVMHVDFRDESSETFKAVASLRLPDASVHGAAKGQPPRTLPGDYTVFCAAWEHETHAMYQYYSGPEPICHAPACRFSKSLGSLCELNQEMSEGDELLLWEYQSLSPATASSQDTSSEHEQGTLHVAVVPASTGLLEYYALQVSTTNFDGFPLDHMEMLCVTISRPQGLMFAALSHQCRQASPNPRNHFHPMGRPAQLAFIPIWHLRTRLLLQVLNLQPALVRSLRTTHRNDKNVTRIRQTTSTHMVAHPRKPCVALALHESGSTSQFVLTIDFDSPRSSRSAIC